MSFQATTELEAEVNELITHYPVKRAASLMVLHAIQEKFGWISSEAVQWTARKLELQPINVFEILTFYPMLRQEPQGKYAIKVCRTLSCALGGAYDLRNRPADWQARGGRLEQEQQRRQQHVNSTGVCCSYCTKMRRRGRARGHALCQAVTCRARPV